MDAGAASDALPGLAGRLLAACAPLPPVRMALVHPCSGESLRGAIEARNRHLIEPVLVGPERRLRDIAAAEGLDLAGVEVVATAHSHASAQCAAALAASGNVQALVKGSLHTDELLHAVLDPTLQLRTERRLSHVFVLEVAAYPRLLLVTDAAINIVPTLAEKRDIVQNAIDLAHRVGVAQPRVAVLAAVETIHVDMRSTLDAAALCKMAERGQICGGILDGPLAFDNAVSPDAARIKGIQSDVAGRADILVVPDLEAGNMLVKQLILLGGAQSAGIVMGARVPIVLTSRADSVRTRISSTALGALLAQPAGATALPS